MGDMSIMLKKYEEKTYYSGWLFEKLSLEN